MKEALSLAKCAAQNDEVPVGAVVVFNGKIIGRGSNDREEHQNVTGHAEVNAMTDAAKNLGFWRLDGCDLYVTLEPCLMCAGAIIQSHIRNVYFGASDPKSGMAGSICNVFALPGNHHCNVQGGLLAEASSLLLKSFFQAKRQNKVMPCAGNGAAQIADCPKKISACPEQISACPKQISACPESNS